MFVGVQLKGDHRSVGNLVVTALNEERSFSEVLTFSRSRCRRTSRSLFPSGRSSSCYPARDREMHYSGHFRRVSGTALLCFAEAANYLTACRVSLFIAVVSVVSIPSSVPTSSLACRKPEAEKRLYDFPAQGEDGHQRQSVADQWMLLRAGREHRSWSVGARPGPYLAGKA